MHAASADVAISFLLMPHVRHCQVSIFLFEQSASMIRRASHKCHAPLVGNSATRSAHRHSRMLMRSSLQLR